MRVLIHGKVRFRLAKRSIFITVNSESRLGIEGSVKVRYLQSRFVKLGRVVCSSMG